MNIKKLNNKTFVKEEKKASNKLKQAKIAISMFCKIWENTRVKDTNNLFIVIKNNNKQSM